MESQNSFEKRTIFLFGSDAVFTGTQGQGFPSSLSLPPNLPSLAWVYLSGLGHKSNPVTVPGGGRREHRAPLRPQRPQRLLAVRAGYFQSIFIIIQL